MLNCQVDKTNYLPQAVHGNIIVNDSLEFIKDRFRGVDVHYDCT
jgi:hypothetical protein